MSRGQSAGVHAEDDLDELVDEAVGDERDDEDDENDEVEMRAGFGIFQCLPVEDAGEDDQDDEGFAGGLATTVEAYLRQVRRQANALPDVVTVRDTTLETDMDTDTYDDDDGTYDEHDEYESEELEDELEDEASRDWTTKKKRGTRPSMVWVRSFLTHVVSLRRELRGIRDGTGDARGRCLLAISDQKLLGIGQLRLHELLAKEAETIERRGITPECAKRVYEISLLLDWPCHSDTLATMRRLVRVCSQQGSAPHRPTDGDLALLNIVIAICGGIFGQDEELAGVVPAEEEEAFGETMNVRTEPRVRVEFPA